MNLITFLTILFHSLFIDCLTPTPAYKNNFAQSPQVLVIEIPL